MNTRTRLGGWLGALAGFLLAAGTAGAADRYWVGNAGANWSATTSWSESSGGASGASVPGSGDTAIFDSGKNTSAILDASFGGTVGAVDIRSGYTATITQRRNLTVGGAFALAAGAKWNYTAGTAATLDVGGSMTVDGTLECQATSTTAGTEGVGRTFTVGGNLVVGATGVVTANDMGFGTGTGPGTPGTAGNNHRGGAHGGKGGNSDTTYPTATYGNYMAPVSLGSGGANAGGAGAIRFTVRGATTNDGAITANASNDQYARGAGGSVFLTSGALAGSGHIRANGGTASGTSGGGGGRVSLVVTNVGADFGTYTLANVSAYGGAGNANRGGGAGTVYLETQAHGAGNGILIVDNNNLTTVWDQSATIPAGQTWTVPLLVVTNRGILEAGHSSVLRLKSSGIAGSLAAGEGVRIRGGQLVLTESYLNVTNGWDLIVDGSATVTGNVTVCNGGVITHTANNNAWKMDLTVVGNLTVDPGGRIDVVAKGSVATLGGATHVGVHGGEGLLDGNPHGTPYGSVTAPVTLGGGGYQSGSPGGGAIHITVTGGVLTNNGTISADGASYGWSGAGGSVWLTVPSLAGVNGVISADGGVSGTQRSGGGRVAVVLTGNELTTNDSIAGQTITAKGGLSAAAPGTVYLKGASQTYGTLIVDNGGGASTAKARITSTVTDAAVGAVIIRNGTRFQVDADQTLTVHGSWSNALATHFTAGALGAVHFAGAAPATLWGSTTFNTFRCTAPGKMLQFEAGKTNIVTGRLALTGASGNLISLASTSPGTQWIFRAPVGSLQENVSFLSVRDSNAGPHPANDMIVATDSTDGGNNPNWIFAAGTADIVWDGSASTDWNTPANWDLDRVPLAGDPSITIPTPVGGVPPNQPVLDKSYVSPGFDGDLIIQSGATLNLAGRSLRIGGDVTVAGTLTATGSETLTFERNVDLTGGTFNRGQSTLRLTGTGTQSLTTGGNTFHILDFATTQAVTVTDTFAARDLAFLATSANVTFHGGFTVENVDLVVSGGAALTVGAGQTYAVGNRFRLVGASGSPIVLDGSGAWNLNVAVPTVVKHVSARNSNASGGHMIYAIDSTDNLGNSNWNFGNWKVWSGTASTIFTNGANWVGGTAPGPADFVLLDGNGANAPRVSTPVTIGRLAVGVSQATTLTIDTNLTVTGDATVHANGTLTHTANGTTAQGEMYKLNLTVGGDLMVNAGGRFDVADKGYAVGNGPGGRPNTDNNHRGGAYGGEGGGADATYPTACYGRMVAPMHIGSGGSYATGAGAIRLVVTGTLINNGVISANSSTDQYGRGSAGSLYATAGAMAGAGVFSANGGAATTGFSSGGGGGRVALVVTDAGADFSLIDLAKVTARGGTGASSAHGGAGTVYLQPAVQGAGKGTVWVDNGGLVGTRTDLPARLLALPDELRNTSVIVTNRGALAVTTSDRIGSLTVVSANEPLNLGPADAELEVQSITVNGTDYTKPGKYTAASRNGFATPSNVSGLGAILIQARGTTFQIR